MERTQPQEEIKPNWFDRHKVITSISIVALFVVLMQSLFGQSSGQKSTTIISPSPSLVTQTQPTPTPTEEILSTPEPLTLEERIKAELNLGADTKVTNVFTSTDTETTTNKELPGKIAVEIDYQMNGTYLDTSWSKRGSWNIDTGIMKDIFPLDSSINTIIMFANVPVTTAYGLDTYNMLDTVTITRDTFAQINFAKFDSQNLPTIADNYVENHNIK